MSGSIAPQWLFQIFDDNGNIAAGAKLFSYVAGTTEPTPVYADYACTTPLENPYTANSAGRVNFWLKDGIGYRLKVEDAVGNVLCDRWPIYGAGSGLSGEDHLVIADVDDTAPGTLEDKLEDSPSIAWEVTETGGYKRVSGSVVDMAVATEISSLGFNGAVNWVEDLAGELWENALAPLAFRMDFKRRPFTKLKYVKTEFSAHISVPVGRFAVYGDLDTKIYEGVLPDVTGIHVFDTPLDVSAYEYIIITMDPGVSTSPQPLSQSISVFPASTALSRYAFAGTFVHEHNTTFPDTCPAMISSDIKYFLARWCVLGMI